MKSVTANESRWEPRPGGQLLIGWLNKSVVQSITSCNFVQYLCNSIARGGRGSGIGYKLHLAKQATAIVEEGDKIELDEATQTTLA